MLLFGCVIRVFGERSVNRRCRFIRTSTGPPSTTLSWHEHAGNIWLSNSHMERVFHEQIPLRMPTLTAMTLQALLSAQPYHVNEAERRLKILNLDRTRKCTASTWIHSNLPTVGIPR
jgi:hypothetical protein